MAPLTELSISQSPFVNYGALNGATELREVLFFSQKLLQMCQNLLRFSSSKGTWAVQIVSHHISDFPPSLALWLTSFWPSNDLKNEAIAFCHVWYALWMSPVGKHLAQSESTEIFMSTILDGLTFWGHLMMNAPSSFVKSTLIYPCLNQRRTSMIRHLDEYICEINLALANYSDQLCQVGMFSQINMTFSGKVTLSSTERPLSMSPHSNE